MTFAIVNVLPLPVMPSRVCCLMPAANELSKDSMAAGWSPFGSYSLRSLKSGILGNSQLVTTGGRFKRAGESGLVSALPGRAQSQNAESQSRFVNGPDDSAYQQPAPRRI